jgi:hypothetical protein
MTPISKNLEDISLPYVLRNYAPEWSPHMDHSHEYNLNNPYSSQPYISDSDKDQERTPQQISNFKAQIA